MKHYFSRNLLIGMILGSLTTFSHVTHAEGHDRRDGIWRINKDRWSAEDEKNYSNFVAAIGEAKCSGINRCLISDANPYKAQNPAWIKSVYSDCADLPYILRMYFAYMNDLPFSYQSGMVARGSSKDIRYSANGNAVSNRRVISSGESLQATMTSMGETVTTAMFRVPPDATVAEGSMLFTDMYSAKIDRSGMQPGTNLYDPNGHVAVIYKIESDGRIKYMDAHPGNSLTRGVYGEKFIRSRPTSGAGFKNWRPTIYADGKVRGIANEKIPTFSLVQYYGNQNASDSALNWKKGSFVKDGQTLDYYDYVRTMLAEGNLRYEPVVEFQNSLDALCGDFSDRINAVNDALAKGIQNQPHPERLPLNIYGTDGEWETYSTPSRDARLKASFREIQKSLEQFVALLEQKSPRIQYNGNVVQLKRDLLAVYEKTAPACVFSYKKSNNQMQQLSLEDVEERLFDLSFSPYHCAELRWGARGQELASCPDSKNKMDWYVAQARLRNQIERTYEVRMDFTISELMAKKAGSGVDNPPKVSLKAYLQQ